MESGRTERLYTAAVFERLLAAREIVARLVAEGRGGNPVTEESPPVADQPAAPPEWPVSNPARPGSAGEIAPPPSPAAPGDEPTEEQIYGELDRAGTARPLDGPPVPPGPVGLFDSAAAPGTAESPPAGPPPDRAPGGVPAEPPGPVDPAGPRFPPPAGTASASAVSAFPAAARVFAIHVAEPLPLTPPASPSVPYGPSTSAPPGTPPAPVPAPVAAPTAAVPPASPPAMPGPNGAPPTAMPGPDGADPTAAGREPARASGAAGDNAAVTAAMLVQRPAEPGGQPTASPVAATPIAPASPAVPQPPPAGPDPTAGSPPHPAATPSVPTAVVPVVPSAGDVPAPSPGAVDPASGATRATTARPAKARPAASRAPAAPESTPASGPAERPPVPGTAADPDDRPTDQLQRVGQVTRKRRTKAAGQRVRRTGESAETPADAGTGTAADPASRSVPAAPPGPEPEWDPATGLPLGLAPPVRSRPGVDRPPWWNAVKIAGVAAAVVLFLVASVGWASRVVLDGSLRDVDVLDPQASAVIDPSAQSGDQNYLITATAGGGGGGALRTIMLVHLPGKGDRAVVTSLPAGLAADRPDCDHWNAAAADYAPGVTPAQPRVTLARAYEIGGPRCLIRSVQRLTGLSVNHYAGVDLASVPAMVDAVHGLPVCTADPSAPSRAGTTDPTILTGAQAATFVGGGDGASPGPLTPNAPPAGNAGGAAAGLGGPTRDTAGRADPDSADEQVVHEQRFLMAVVDKASSDGVLSSPGELHGFVSALGRGSLTDDAGLTELGDLARGLHRLDPGSVFFTAVPITASPDPRGGVNPAVDRAVELFEAIRTGRPLPGPGRADERTTTSPAPRALPPGEISLAVRNGSTKPELTGRTADSLRALGFQVGATGVAPRTEAGRTYIEHSADRAQQAGAVSAVVPAAVGKTVPGTGVLQLVIGDGFDGQVRAAVPAPVAPGPLTSPVRTLTALRAGCR